MGGRGWRLSSLAWPAFALVGRLRYAQKFVIVGLVLMVPLGFTANAYIDLQRSQISATFREQDGLRYLRSLIVLTSDVVQARRSAVSKGFEDAVDLSSDIAQVDAMDRTVGAALKAGAEWSTARRLVVTAADGTGRTKADQLQAYNTACDALLGLLLAIGDRSNLIHDPDLDSNYLAAVLQRWLPSLGDVAGRIADLMELTAQDRNSDQLGVFIELGKYYGMVSNGQQMIAHAAAVVGAESTTEVAAAVRGQSRDLDAVTGALGDRLAQAVAHRSLWEFPSHSADAVRVAANSFASVAVTELSSLLQARIDRAQARIRQIELWSGIGAALAVYLFIGFYISVVFPIRSIVATLRAVAAGDLSRRVRVSTRDELSYVASVLNETIATTEAMTGRLAYQATRDALTGLPNRSMVLDRVDEALRSAQHTGKPTAVLFLDLDRFKAVNDTMGHEAGDIVLRTVADRLTAATRGSDLVARLAGDEFVVITSEPADVSRAVSMADRIVARISEPIAIPADGGSREASVGASIGIAFVTPETTVASASDMLRDADAAMYLAKQRGRNRVEIFDASVSNAVEQRGRLEQDLRRAIVEDQFLLHYQPIVELAGATGVEGGSVVGFEALVRWQHPTRGLLYPDEFIPLAEQTGLIVPVGAWVLGEACRQVRRWQEGRPDRDRLRISINVSAGQLSHPSFIPMVAGTLRATGLDPGNVWLEFTESAVHTDVDAAAAAMDELRALGVHLALDDFGTGYSSLAYLRRFPVEMLKIDRSFVQGMTESPQDAAIVEMVIGLARIFELVVIAEGVETVEQKARLHELGFTLCQGYLLGRPTPPQLAWADPVAVPTPTAVTA